MYRELLGRIVYFLTARCALRDLEAWLLANLQRILDSGDEPAIRTANQVDVDFVELGEGLIDEATIRERLDGYARLGETISRSFEMTPRVKTFLTSTSAQTVRHRVETPRQVVDYRLAHRFA